MAENHEQALSAPDGARTPPSAGDRGANLVEYGLLVALIAIVCLAALMFFGDETSESFSNTKNSIEAAND